MSCERVNDKQPPSVVPVGSSNSTMMYFLMLFTSVSGPNTCKELRFSKELFGSLSSMYVSRSRVPEAGPGTGVGLFEGVSEGIPLGSPEGLSDGRALNNAAPNSEGSIDG